LAGAAFLAAALGVTCFLGVTALALGAGGFSVVFAGAALVGFAVVLGGVFVLVGADFGLAVAVFFVVTGLLGLVGLAGLRAFGATRLAADLVALRLGLGAFFVTAFDGDFLRRATGLALAFAFDAAAGRGAAFFTGFALLVGGAFFPVLLVRGLLAAAFFFT
jgi:hypothetical protein